MTGIMHTARTSTVKVIVNSDKSNKDGEVINMRQAWDKEKNVALCGTCVKYELS